MSNIVAQKRRGRPRVGETPHISLRIPNTVLDALARWAESQREPISRSEAINQIIAAHLRRRGLLK